jgi:hypothetical protein
VARAKILLTKTHVIPELWASVPTAVQEVDQIQVKSTLKWLLVSEPADSQDSSFTVGFCPFFWDESRRTVSPKIDRHFQYFDCLSVQNWILP